MRTVPARRDRTEKYRISKSGDTVLSCDRLSVWSSLFPAAQPLISEPKYRNGSDVRRVNRGVYGGDHCRFDMF